MPDSEDKKFSQNPRGKNATDETLRDDKLEIEGDVDIEYEYEIPPSGDFPPPPPFGMPFPPPPLPPFGMPFPPPPPPFGMPFRNQEDPNGEFEEYEEEDDDNGTETPKIVPDWRPIERIEYETTYYGDVPADEEDYAVDYVDEIPFNPTDESSPHKKSVIPRNLDATKFPDKSEEEIRKDPLAMRVVRIGAKILSTLFVLSLLAGACFLFIHYYYEKISERGRITNEMLKKEEVSEAASEAIWRLRNNRSNNIIKVFYESVSDIATMSDFSDMLLKGTISIGDKTEDFYCIKTTNKSFVKIGSGSKERTYLVGTFGEGVTRLVDGRLAGKRQQLGERDALVMRAIVSFDDSLFSRAFGSQSSKNAHGFADRFVYEGQPTFEGKECDSISINEAGDCHAQFYFDLKNHFLKAATYSAPYVNVTVHFEKYTDSDNSYKAPEIRKIYVDGAPYAKLGIDFIVRNRGLILPQ